MSTPVSRPGLAAQVALLAVTVLGTMSNNVVNVPLNDIAADLDVPVASAVLAVSAFVLTLAVAMPLTGWIGDRLGPKRTLVGALVLMVLGQLAAAAAPTLPTLVSTRAVQGLACSAIPPIVMGMLARLYPEQRLRVMGAWAAANGVGQAVGPPVGGLVNDLVGWRVLFLCMAGGSVVTLVALLRAVPAQPPVRGQLHVAGAFLLTSGAALALVAVTASSQRGTDPWLVGAAGMVGVLLLVGFVVVSRGRPNALVPPRLIVEIRFLRSSVAAFCQMFLLGSVLVVVPLHLTGAVGLSTSAAGVIFFALPLVMTLAAPVVGRAGGWVSPRAVLRTGLSLLVIGAAVFGALADRLGQSVSFILVMLVALAVGIAMVQTPAAAGATRSPAGQRGAALGLFNMTRFSGSTVGTAWVALAYPGGGVATVMAGCAAVVAVGLTVSLVGPNPPVGEPEAPPSPA